MLLSSRLTIRLLLLLSAAAGFAQTPAHPPVLAPATDPQKPLSAEFTKTLDGLFNKGDFRSKRPVDSRWLDGGDRYTVLEKTKANADAEELVAYQTATESKTVLVTAAQFTPAGAKAPLSVEEYTWSPDKKHLLIFTNSKRVWRRNTRGDYWVLDLPESGSSATKLTKLGGDAPESTLMFATFSPDSNAVAYVRQNNLYVEFLATHQVTQLTKDGSDEIINGTTDWVTEEEFDLRDAFRWSPDSKTIAYWQFDQAGVGDYTLLNDTKSEYPVKFHYRYPQVGTTNAAVRVGVLPVSGGATRWIELPGDPRNHYIPRMDWTGVSDELALEYLNRLQNTNDVYLANATTGKARLLFDDKDAAWVEVVDELKWLAAKDKSKSDLLWLSERDGWRHAYRVSHETGDLKLITHFDADVIEPVALDEAHGFLYFTASPTDPIRVYLYRARLDGSGTPERVTPMDQVGFHAYDIAPNGRYAIHHFRTSAVAPKYDLIDLEKNKVVRTLTTNDDLTAKAKQLGPDPVFSETLVSGGVRLSTMMIAPPNFDPTKKYPVLVYVYGEPAAAMVRDDGSSLVSRVMAREGYIVLSFDNQGTPQPRGREWRKIVYGSIGVLSSQQQAEAVREFAKEHAFVDTSRMAIWGWSGGGTNTLNLMFRSPGLFSTGIAVASVPDQTHYDTIYQERYMGLPKDNARGYHDGSAINFAEGLAGNLLIIHGSGDDNVHFQGAELLVNRLIELGKTFDFMDYPNRTHGIYEGAGTSMHVYSLIMRYLEQHVPPGPR